jgi:hypothetical protein
MVAAPGAWKLMRLTALSLWKDWPQDMQVSAFNIQNRTITLRGTCPHPECKKSSAFLLVTNMHLGPKGEWVGALQCQACLKYILALARQVQHDLTYEDHYPLGSPDDVVAAEIPEHIQRDFKEALRCMFVDAYNATAEMCRRALEASCIERGAAPNKVLETMIDSLEEKRVITPFLRDVAHKIRLGGNRGAHPPADGAEAQNVELEPVVLIEKEHAEAIIKFTREFFHHVYVVPSELAKYDFSKPKTANSPRAIP